MRQDCSIVWTRVLRLRLFPTDYGHAALHRAIGVTCAYQSDSSSKRPVASVAFGTTPPPPHQPFSTCWRRRGASKNAPRPAAGLVRGPHPTAPRSVRQHVESGTLLPIPSTRRSAMGSPGFCKPFQPLAILTFERSGRLFSIDANERRFLESSATPLAGQATCRTPLLVWPSACGLLTSRLPLTRYLERRPSAGPRFEDGDMRDLVRVWCGHAAQTSEGTV
jgi:hypothetical protein